MTKPRITESLDYIPVVIQGALYADLYDKAEGHHKFLARIEVKEDGLEAAVRRNFLEAQQAILKNYDIDVELRALLPSDLLNFSVFIPEPE